jgi:hypothetical protein
MNIDFAAMGGTAGTVGGAMILACKKKKKKKKIPERLCTGAC